MTRGQATADAITVTDWSTPRLQSKQNRKQCLALILSSFALLLRRSDLADGGNVDVDLGFAELLAFEAILKLSAVLGYH